MSDPTNTSFEVSRNQIIKLILCPEDCCTERRKLNLEGFHFYSTIGLFRNGVGSLAH